MAINMTVDGITKEVTKLKLVGADGTTKTATLTETTGSSSSASMEGLSMYHRAEHQVEANSSYATPYQINHNAGFVPDMVVLRRIVSPQLGSDAGLFVLSYLVKDGNIKCVGANAAEKNTMLNINLTSMSVDDSKIMYQPSSNDLRLYAGSTFEILCFKFENSLA